MPLIIPRVQGYHQVIRWVGLSTTISGMVKPLGRSGMMVHQILESMSTS